MKCMLFGGSGQVGGAVARALLGSDSCTALTLLLRRPIAELENAEKARQVIVDTGAEDFGASVEAEAVGHDVAISCIGIGSGTMFMDEAVMTEIEVNMVGKFARGCKGAGIETFELLTAFGVNENQGSSVIKPVRVMSKKHRTVLDVGFEKLAVFKPGIIVGNTHTPGWMAAMTSLIPSAMGLSNIRQEQLAAAFVAHLEKVAPSQDQPVVYYGNKEMRALLAD